MRIIRKKEINRGGGEARVRGNSKPIYRKKAVVDFFFFLDPVSRLHFKPDRGCWFGSSKFVKTQILTKLHIGYIIAN